MARRRLTEAQIEKAAELREMGWSLGRLACHFDCSESAMAWHMLRVGADAPKTAAKVLSQTAPGPTVHLRGDHLVRRYSPEEDAELLRLAAEGAGDAAIGRAMQPPRRPNSIRGRLMTLARHDARREASA